MQWSEETFHGVLYMGITELKAVNCSGNTTEALRQLRYITNLLTKLIETILDLDCWKRPH